MCLDYSETSAPPRRMADPQGARDGGGVMEDKDSIIKMLEWECDCHRELHRERDKEDRKLLRLLVFLLIISLLNGIVAAVSLYLKLTTGVWL